MSKQGEILLCEKCGNEVTVTKEGKNPCIECCGRDKTTKKEE